MRLPWRRRHHVHSSFEYVRLSNTISHEEHIVTLLMDMMRKCWPKHSICVYSANVFGWANGVGHCGRWPNSQTHFWFLATTKNIFPKKMANKEVAHQRIVVVRRTSKINRLWLEISNGCGFVQFWLRIFLNRTSEWVSGAAASQWHQCSTDPDQYQLFEWTHVGLTAKYIHNSLMPHHMRLVKWMANGNLARDIVPGRKSPHIIDEKAYYEMDEHWTVNQSKIMHPQNHIIKSFCWVCVRVSVCDIVVLVLLGKLRWKQFFFSFGR